MTKKTEPKSNESSYAGHKPDFNLGVISPTATLSSMPYVSEEVMPEIRYF